MQECTTGLNKFLGNMENTVQSIEISVADQKLVARQENEHVLEYSISTAKNGVGQLKGSECTPLGQHRIRAKIGKGQPQNTVFIGRRATGELYSESLSSEQPNRDWILTRIMWLCGNESGVNRLGKVDTMNRYIYIHGAPDSHAMGTPSSHGCIKMRNRDVIELFDHTPVGTPVVIKL
jgi:lipoprotein-anchoring transpeptidase ErfK/SrfK